MRLKYNETQKGRCYYIIRSIYKNGKNTSETFEKLGYPDEISKKQGCSDPFQWMQNHLSELNDQEKEQKAEKVLVSYNPHARIPKGQQQSFNVGYLFLQKVYHELCIDLIASHITKRHHFQYDIAAILSRLIYGHILFPGSKLSTCRLSKKLLEAPGFEYHQVGRALSVIASEFDAIQAELYQFSSAVVPRKTGVLYYDCTNFYFETEEEDDISNEEADAADMPARKYGPSKQHQPSPFVLMGLFMDYTALSLIVETGDFKRFAKGNVYAAYLGLTPGEHSSSDSINRTGITKAGNRHLRSLLIESAGGICKGAVGHKSKNLRARQNGNTAEVIAYADKANTRLRSRYYKFIRHGKKRNVAVAAIARELACFVWGMMTDNIEVKAA